MDQPFAVKFMDMVAIVMFYQFFRQFKHARKDGQGCCLALKTSLLDVVLLVSLIAAHEWGHAVTMEQYGCEEVFIYHRLSWGFAGCSQWGEQGGPLGNSTSAEGVALQDAKERAKEVIGDMSSEINDRIAELSGKKHMQWWIVANGTLIGLAYLLLFCAALRLVSAAIDLGSRPVSHAYDLGVGYSLIYYPLLSLALQWGDFVKIYDSENHAPLVVFFLCVQAAFVACMSPCRFAAGKILCCGMCRSDPEKRRQQQQQQRRRGKKGGVQATPQGAGVTMAAQPVDVSAAV